MKHVIKRYQYWWNTGEGYSLEEFETPRELLDLIASYPTHDFYLTEKVRYLPSIDFEKEQKEREEGNV